MVMPGRRFLGSEIRDCLIKFENGVFQELDAVIDCSLLSNVEDSELPFDSGIVVGGGSDLIDGVVYGRGYDLREGFGGEVRKRSEGRNAEFWVECAFAG